MKEGFKDLEDYGIIGNLETCALIGSDGSVDWLCLPYLESPSVFGALLDLNKGGRFRITPVGKYRSIQGYAGDTNVLRTTFHSPLGIAAITDFMPVKTIEDKAFITTLFRKVEWIKRGELELEVDFRPRFDYGSAVPAFQKSEGGVVAKWGDESIFFHSPVPLQLDHEGARATLRAGDERALWFVLQYNNQRELPPDEYEQFLVRTLDFWKKWSHICSQPDCLFTGPWHNIVIRSGLILKLLTNSDNGAIAAAATTSVPEEIGGIRNWDYRYSWIRDSAFTVQALYHLGHEEEAARFRTWMHGIVKAAKNISELRILYSLRGEPDLTERVLDNLSGYRNSHPVRIGNVASGQKQLDIYGEFVNSLFDTTRYGEHIHEEAWTTLKDIVDYVCQVWDTKDNGIWEVRKAPQHYVYSKLMCWVAVDRGTSIARIKRFDAPFEKWMSAKKDIEQAILDRGFNRDLNSFVATFGSRDLDSTSLLIPVMGFLPFRDSRVQGTIDAVMKYLMSEDGLVARYNMDDGLPGKEGKFVLCSFWLVIALSLSGRTDEAENLFTKLIKYVSPLGIISEEVDPKTGKLLGNMPQAFSHIGLINAALQIGIGRGKKYKGPMPIGDEQKRAAHAEAAPVR